MISIRLDDDARAAGEFVTGRVYWSAEGDRRPRRILVAAVWETEGVGNPARGVGRAMVFTPRRGQREATFPFRLLIPYEGPITFNGQFIGIVWKLRVRVDQRGFDEHEESTLRVEPRSRRSAAAEPVHQGRIE